MPELVLDDLQAKIVTEATGAVPIVDRSGRVIGHAEPICTPLTPDRVAAAEQRLDSDGPWLTTSEILQHLRSLGVRRLDVASALPFL
jgi:hypothetical protein